MATDEEQLVLSISADTRQILRAMKRLEGDIAKSSAGIEKRFAAVGKGIDKAMPTAVQERINRMVGAQVEATKEWTGALADQGREMERLRARFNPIFSTVTRYKSAIGEIRAAHRLGAISADEMTAAIQRERQAALASIAAIKGRNAALADTPAVMGFGKGASSFNTANIAAQFQDIAVMAQMGIANPMTIALQQGTQLAAVFNQMGGTRDVIRGLGSAFLSIVNPVSLVTVGTIAAGVAAYNYFSSVDEGTADTKEALKEQEDLIRRVAQAWGDVLPAIRAVAAERERLAGQGDIEKTTQQEIARVFEEIGQEVTSAGDQVTDLMDALRNIAPPEQLVAWQAALREVSTTAAENKTTVEEMRAAQKAALDLFASTGIPVFKDTADAIELMIPRLQVVREEIGRLAEADATAKAINDLQAEINKISSSKARGELDDLLKKAREGEISIKDLLAELARISGYAPDVSGIIGAFRAVAEAADAARKASSGFTGKESQGGRVRYGSTGYMQLPDSAPTPDRRVDPYFQDWRTKEKQGRAPKRTADDRFFEDIEAIKQRTIALAEERAMLGLSYEAQQKRKVAFDLEQKALKDVREAARQKGVQDWQNAELTPDQIRQIDEVSAAYARQAEELRSAQEQSAFWSDALYGVFTDLVPAVETGNKALDNFLNKLIEVGLQAALLGKGPFGSGGGGLIGGLLRGIGIPGFANGTNSAPGGLAWVGERGPELVNLPRGSQVIPNHRIPVPRAPSIAPTAAMPSTTYAPVYQIDARGADAAAVARLEAGLKERDRKFGTMVDRRVDTRHFRKTRA